MKRPKGYGRNKLLALFREIEELLVEAERNRGYWDWVDTHIDFGKIKEKWLDNLK